VASGSPSLSPSASVSPSASPSVEPTGTHKGIVMNLLNQAISTYSNFNFNSIACFNGTYLGATDTGIYPLGGNKDNGSDINSRIKTGSMDFGDTIIKYARDVWITHRTDGYLTLVIYVNEDTKTTIEKQTKIVSNEMKEERIKPPRGLRGRFYTVELKNLSGADFDIDSLGMLVESIKRKVR
jgi:hypothetical protein